MSTIANNVAYVPQWKQLCIAALAELNPAKVPERIAVARSAVLDQIEDNLSKSSSATQSCSERNLAARNWRRPQDRYMLVIVSVSRLDNDRIEIGVARPQHDSNPTHNYPREKEVRAVLSDFGISEEIMASHLKLLAQMGANEQLKFPPMDVPQHELRSKGFRL